MFNRRIRDDEAAVGEIIDAAVRRATAPNQPTHGNAAGVVGGVSNNFITAPPEPTEERLPIGVYPDEIGMDADGNMWVPFHLGIDTPDNEFAYVPTGYPVYDYGR